MTKDNQQKTGNISKLSKKQYFFSTKHEKYDKIVKIPQREALSKGSVKG